MKKITYDVTKDDITPKGITEIGFAGEHLATRIIFNLAEELIDADEYWLYITNGGGEFFAVDDVIYDGESIYYDLPNFVTAMSGIVKIQLVIKSDECVLFTFPCKLRVLSSAERTTAAVNYLSEISDALRLCKNSAALAEETLNTVNDNSDMFVKTVGDIETALEEIAFIQESYIGGNE